MKLTRVVGYLTTRDDAAPDLGWNLRTEVLRDVNIKVMEACPDLLIYNNRWGV